MSLASARSNALLMGVGLVFLPGLFLATSLDYSLRGVWAAKVGLNTWRCATAVYRIHFELWSTWEEHVAREELR